MYPNNPMPIRYYQKTLAHTIPSEAYKPAYYKLLYMSIHAVWIFGLMGMISISSSWLCILFISVLIGFSIVCLFLYSHELSHGAVIKKRKVSYLIKNFFWAFSGIPPTVWDRVHNHTHHHTMNTPNDPDRKTHISEKNIWNDIYNLFIYPNKVIRYSLTIGFAMVFYSVKHTVAVFYSDAEKPAIVTYRPSYNKKQKRKVIIEICYIICFWLSIWYLIGIEKGVVMSAVSWVSYSSFVIIFIITQHLGRPLYKDVSDPLLTSTSVIIPRWLDRIIDWHSFHVEHHMFPSINFDYYPQLSKKIENKYPQKYHRIPFFKALKDTFKNGVYIEDPFH